MKLKTAAVLSGLLFAAVPALFAEDTGAGAANFSTGTAIAPPAGLVSGYRGTAIPVTADQLLYVKKGDRIDLLVTFEALIKEGTKGEVKEMTTATILQNIIVINVRKPEKPDGLGAIELLLNPNEAQYAALSVAQGKGVNIAVRSPDDVELHPMEMASFRRLIK